MIGRALLLAIAAATVVSAQPAPRRATNLAALLTYPGFFHLRPVIVAGTLEREAGGQLRLQDEVGSMRILHDGSAPDGLVEIRGEYWDLGRMNADDPRLSRYDLRAGFGIDPEGAWPRPGQALAIVASAVDAATLPSEPSIRALVLHPSRFEERVTVVGQFAGRNLLGDLPDAPANSRYDFVLRSADAAIWVSNARPRGRGFELALDARIDTGRWLEVSGTVHRARGLQWIDADPDSLVLAKPPEETPVQTQIPVPAAPPPEVIFSTPIGEETDVGTATSVRLQFSRDIDPASVKGRIRVGYLAPGAAAGSVPGERVEGFTTRYQPANRVLEIEFGQPLERFRTVQVELLEGIEGTDGQLLERWTLLFTTGAS